MSFTSRAAEARQSPIDIQFVVARRLDKLSGMVANVVIATEAGAFAASNVLVVVKESDVRLVHSLQDRNLSMHFRLEFGRLKLLDDAVS